MAGHQAVQEDAASNGGVEVVKKVNINFGSLRLNDSKKRFRPPGANCQMTEPPSAESSQMSDVVQSSSLHSGHEEQMAADDYTRKIYKAKRLKPPQ